MDPEANLKEQLALAESILKAFDGEEGDEGEDDMANADIDDLLVDAKRLAELVEELNEWISRGGFLPKDWRRS